MDQLVFNIRGQHISREDRYFVAARSQNFLYASFVFLTGEWEGTAKTAIFAARGSAYKVILSHEGKALVPWEVLTEPGEVLVSVYGAAAPESNTVVIETANHAVVKVSPSLYELDAVNEPEPTPDVWEQILTKMDHIDGGTFGDPQATIQLRRGQEEDFDAADLEDGELAVSTDAQKVRVRFDDENTKELALQEGVDAIREDLQEQVDDILSRERQFAFYLTEDGQLVQVTYYETAEDPRFFLTDDGQLCVEYP